MSVCAAKYALACTKPFAPSAIGACVPTTPAIPTQKVRLYNRGVVTIGTNGEGWVAVAPTLANDENVCFYTKSGWAGSTIDAAVPLAGGTGVQQFDKGPYSSLDLNKIDEDTGVPLVSGRIVSCALSMTYTGTELDRGGELVCYADADHSSVQGMSFGEVSSLATAEVDAPGPNREKCWQVLHGVHPHEFTFPLPSTYDDLNDAKIKRTFPYCRGQTVVNVLQGAPIMCAYVTGKAGATYRWEIIQHVEYVGQLTETQLSPTESDPSGFNLVQSALGTLPMAKVSAPKKKLSALMKEELRKAAKKHGPAALKAGRDMLISLL